jgi:hypothetical protein
LTKLSFNVVSLGSLLLAFSFLVLISFLFWFSTKGWSCYSNTFFF